MSGSETLTETNNSTNTGVASYVNLHQIKMCDRERSVKKQKMSYVFAVKDGEMG